MKRGPLPSQNPPSIGKLGVNQCHTNDCAVRAATGRKARTVRAHKRGVPTGGEIRKGFPEEATLKLNPCEIRVAQRERREKASREREGPSVSLRGPVPGGPVLSESELKASEPREGAGSNEELRSPAKM